jgi:sulfite reductase (NADPH) hemoprotein beta-component
MYRYDEFDSTIVQERVNQFRGQVARRVAGELTEDQFRPLRLKNGLYLQLHAYMLRIAVPYGVLSSKQVRKLAYIARRYDRGFGHFTTRQNIQFNWPQLARRAGHPAAPRRRRDARHPDQRQLHPQRDLRPVRRRRRRRDRGSAHLGGDRAAVVDLPSRILLPAAQVQDRGDRAPDDRAADPRARHRHPHREERGGRGGFEVWVGGGLGRTPIIGVGVPQVPAQGASASRISRRSSASTTCSAGATTSTRRASRSWSRRPAATKFAAQVEEEWEKIKNGPLHLPQAEIDRIHRYFAPPAYDKLDDNDPAFETAKLENPDFARWVRTNTVRHRVPGYIIANISLKPEGGAPGDASADQMDLMADLADEFSMNEVRVTHHQNIVFPNVRKRDLFALWQRLKPVKLATPNLGFISDIIACPGLDYCNLANARSIPVAQRLSRHFGDPRKLDDIGELRLNISGCINACGHHHVGHIGILGVDKQGQEFYQVTVGGSSKDDASLGKIVGASFSEDDIVPAIDTIINTYLANRTGKGERFLDYVRRVGVDPFKEALYGPATARRPAAE